MIRIEQLSKNYGPVEALRDVSLTVESGEIVGLLGPNGAGKTTAMKVVTCYMPPSSGRVSVDGLDTIEQALEVRRRIGYLAEHNPLYHDMSVAEYLDFAARLHGLPSSRAPAAITRAVGRCGLGDYRHRLIGQLSKGYRQRVGLAQAILHDPEVLILDEPTSGLDPNQILEIRHLIKELGRAKTVILSTHIMQEVEAVCSRVLIINRGRIVADDTAENLLRQRAGVVRTTAELATGGREAAAVERLLRERLPLGELDARATDQGLRVTLTPAAGEDLREPLFRLAVEQGWVLLELSRSQNTLEDVFRELTLEAPREAAA
ncbi:MAG: ATP-binding cassette domain-containing protein [bacterium]|jgi:ABC-2 type transport system ATP-binding protein|nr:ATP-binding cassette domain-containing protein [bacterium]